MFSVALQIQVIIFASIILVWTSIGVHLLQFEMIGHNLEMHTAGYVWSHNLQCQDRNQAINYKDKNRGNYCKQYCEAF